MKTIFSNAIIISASRRTDIPAFYSGWFFNRLQAGFCNVVNPMNRKQVRRVDLGPSEVSAFVFWTKNPGPILDRLTELDRRDYDYLFLYTLNDYPTWLEPGLPNLEQRLDTFHQLSDHLGPERVIWRYDPVVLTTSLDVDYHRQVFEGLCQRLTGRTERVIVSLFDPYKFVVSRMNRLLPTGENLLLFEEHEEKGHILSGVLSSIARSYGLQIQSCAEEFDLKDDGIKAGACLDGIQLSRLFEKTCPTKKDPGQRKQCHCVKSVDIGFYDTCRHQCLYCYANRSDQVRQRNLTRHDPLASALAGS